MRRAVFLDLNGTLVNPILVDHPRELNLIGGAADAVARLHSAGFICPVVTVQSRIEKGLFTEADFLEWFATLKDEMAACGAVIEGPYVCPHRPRTRCACAKPNTLLYERAAEDLGIALGESFVIGDSLADVEAARRFGGKGCLVGGGRQPAALADCIAGTLDDAVSWILGELH